jgi:uncharacterized membrane protein YdbT with pleckstrin-like domain
MNYVDDWHIKLNKSPIILLIQILISNIILDIMAIIILLIDYADMISNWHKWLWIEEYFFLWILLLQIIVIVFIFIKWVFKYYLFEANKLTYFSGIIFKKKQEFILDKIWCTSFEQSILWKIFNYWDIFVYVQNEKFKLKWINNPNEFIKLLGNCKIVNK